MTDNTRTGAADGNQEPTPEELTASDIAEAMQELNTSFSEKMSRLLADSIKPLLKNADISGLINQRIQEILKTFEAVQSRLAEQTTDLMPYLEKEAEKLHADHPETADLAADDLLAIALEFEDATEEEIAEEFKRVMQDTAAKGDSPDLLLTYWRECMEAAKAAWFRYIADKREPAQPTISVGAKKPSFVQFPLDKVTREMFSGLEAKTEYSLKSEKTGSKKELTTYLTLDFDENSPIRFRPLSIFEKRVYMACDALQKSGNAYISATEIYRAMGNTGTPAQIQIQRIRDACEQMAIIRATIDNSEEANAYRYPLYTKGSFYIFPVVSQENVKINGKTTNYCIRFLDDLPLVRFAEARNQVERYTLAQMTLPEKMRMTDDNLKLDDYLRYRIARMKGKASRKILFSKIYEHCELNTRDKQSRAAAKIRKLLDHYVATGIINGYQESHDGITVKTKNA